MGLRVHVVVCRGVVLRGGFMLWLVVLMLVIQGGVFILWFEGGGVGLWLQVVGQAVKWGLEW